VESLFERNRVVSMQQASVAKDIIIFKKAVFSAYLFPLPGFLTMSGLSGTVSTPLLDVSVSVRFCHTKLTESVRHGKGCELRSYG